MSMFEFSENNIIIHLGKYGVDIIDDKIEPDGDINITTVAEAELIIEILTRFIESKKEKE